MRDFVRTIIAYMLHPLCLLVDCVASRVEVCDDDGNVVAYVMANPESRDSITVWETVEETESQ